MVSTGSTEWVGLVPKWDSEAKVYGGSYNHSLDSAGRFVMPKAFRTNLGGDFVITRGLGCLRIFPQVYVNKKLAEELGGLGTPLQSLFNPEIVRLTRHFYMDMVLANTDSQNRVQLSSEHRKYAGIETDLVICGCGEYVELWNPEALEKYKDENIDPEQIIAAAESLIPRNQPIPAGAPSGDGESDAGVSQPGSEE